MKFLLTFAVLAISLKVSCGFWVAVDVDFIRAPLQSFSICRAILPVTEEELPLPDKVFEAIPEDVLEGTAHVEKVGEFGHVFSGKNRDTEIIPTPSIDIRRDRTVQSITDEEFQPLPAEFIEVASEEGILERTAAVEKVGEFGHVFAGKDSDTEIIPTPSIDFRRVRTVQSITDEEFQPLPAEFIEVASEEGILERTAAVEKVGEFGHVFAGKDSDTEIIPTPSIDFRRVRTVQSITDEEFQPLPAEFIEVASKEGILERTAAVEKVGEFGHVFAGKDSDTEIIPTPSIDFRRVRTVQSITDEEFQPLPAEFIEVASEEGILERTAAVEEVGEFGHVFAGKDSYTEIIPTRSIDFSRDRTALTATDEEFQPLLAEFIEVAPEEGILERTAAVESVGEFEHLFAGRDFDTHRMPAPSIDFSIARALLSVTEEEIQPLPAEFFVIVPEEGFLERAVPVEDIRQLGNVFNEENIETHPVIYVSMEGVQDHEFALS
ncbi:hypothetical protein SK128_018006 [Halocaridina rubra]|uniref:Uncharacterized protein n=1 Tax=Halocaridina rubra TaxID=373956 RepID=A0AAN8XEV6_HALRR